MTRRGVSAIELVIASALLAAVAVPVLALLSSGHTTAALDELQVVARRRARRAAALLEGTRYDRLLAAATGGPPPVAHPRLAPGSREVFLPLPADGTDVTLDNLPDEALQVYVARVGSMPVQAFVEELEPGLARLAVLASWKEPNSQSPRHLVVVRLLQDPIRGGLR